MKTKFIYLLIASMFGMGSLSAQEIHKVDNEKSNVYVDGTSTLHDWTETAETVSGQLKVDMNGNKIDKLRILKVVVPVKSLKSGKSGMDKNTYAALMADDHPNITFLLKTYTLEGNSAVLTGDLSIAGKTKSVKIPVSYSVKDSHIEFKGSHTFKMTEFGVKPPVAMMGTVKTGDEVTIRFHVFFE